MKYFSISEVLFGIPASFALGAVFAFLHTVLSSIFCGFWEFFKNFKSVSRFFSKTSKNKTKAPRKISDALYFVSEEILNFISVIIFALVFCVFLYIISDGIPRLYIIVITVLSFAVTSKIFTRPFRRISAILSFLSAKLLMGIIFIFTYFPIKFVKFYTKAKKRGKKR